MKLNRFGNGSEQHKKVPYDLTLSSKRKYLILL